MADTFSDTERELPDGMPGLWKDRGLKLMNGISLHEEEILAEIMWHQTRGECWVSNRHLAVIARICERQVRKLLTRLDNAGHLIIENRKGGGPKSRRMWVSREILEACETSSRSSSDAPPPSPSVKPHPDSDPVPTPTSPQAPADRERATPKHNPTTDEHAACELPDYVPREQWRTFVEMKHKEHGPFSEGARNGVLGKLKRYHDEGFDAAKLLTVAVENTWKTVWDRPECKRASGKGLINGLRDGQRTASGHTIMGGRLVL
jgi:hypothetical protein